MKITKADFPALVDFTINLEDRLINPFIDKAFQRDVAPKIGETLAAQILAFEGVEPPLAPDNTVVNEETDTFEFDLAEIPEGDAATALLYDAVKPYWVFAAYVRHLLVHGIFHTQSGLTTPTPDRAEQINDKRRAELMAQVKGDMNFYEGEMMKYIKATYPDESEPTTCGTTKKKNRIGLRVVNSTGNCGTCGRYSCRCY